MLIPSFSHKRGHVTRKTCSNWLQTWQVLSSILRSLRDVYASFPRMAARLDKKDFFWEINPDLIKYASNTFSQTIAHKSLLTLTAAKLKLQRTCFPVVCPRVDENDGIVLEVMGKRSWIVDFLKRKKESKQLQRSGSEFSDRLQSLPPKRCHSSAFLRTINFPFIFFNIVFSNEKNVYPSKVLCVPIKNSCFCKQCNQHSALPRKNHFYVWLIINYYFHYFIWKHGLQLGEERKNKKLNAKSERLKRHSLSCVIQEIYDLSSLSHEFSRKWLNFQFFRISDRSINIILWPHLFKYIEIIILPGNFISLCLCFFYYDCL